MLRQLLIAASNNEKLKELSTSVPLTRQVVRRFVAGDDVADAVGATADLVATGRYVTLDHLGEEVLRLDDAERARDSYLELLDSLQGNGLTGEAELSLKLSSVGQSLPTDGEKISLEFSHEIAARAAQYGTTITLDMEDHTTTDSTLGILGALREEFPKTGAVLQASLFRTEADCQDLAQEGSRIRLCKGAYSEPESVAYQSRHEIDLSFVRCSKVLMEGSGYPMIATHDPRLIEIAQALAIHNDRPKSSYEFQMLFGVRPQEQERLAKEGETVRVYVPYGEDWYGYLVRRMAEKPSNTVLFAKSLSSKK